MTTTPTPRRSLARAAAMAALFTLVVLVAGLLAILPPASADPNTQTQLPADGVQSITYEGEDSWTVTTESPAWEIKLMSPSQQIICGSNYADPCTVSERFTAPAGCVYLQVDWPGGTWNSSDPYVCAEPPTTPPSSSPPPVLTPPPSSPPTVTPEPPVTVTPTPTPTLEPTPTPGVPTPSTPSSPPPTTTPTPGSTPNPTPSATPGPTAPSSPSAGAPPSFSSPFSPPALSEPASPSASSSVGELAATGTDLSLVARALAVVICAIILGGAGLIWVGRRR